MKNLKINAVSLDIAWADIDENLYAAEKILSRLDKDTDVAVLPELFSTGYIASTDLLHNLAEDEANSRTLARIREWARRFNFAVAGSLLIKKDNNIFNRGFFVEPSGESTFYDKKHLFGLSEEARILTAGTRSVPVVRFRGWNIALAVCYDLRFPAWLRNTRYKYDLLILPANWPSKRKYAWEHLLIARAIENQAYIAGVNRSGKDDCGDYDNPSLILDYLGKPIATSATDTPRVMTAVLDLENLINFRNKFPVDNDADLFCFCDDRNQKG